MSGDARLSVLRGQSVALVSTVPFFLVNQLSTHIRHLRHLGMQVTVITSPGDELDVFSDDPGIRVVSIDIPRRIRPWEDLRALARLHALFRRHRFSIVHSTTPKAGLLCAVAARLAGVPVRLHTFTGQVWVGMQGPMPRLLKRLDRLIVRLDTHCYADSPSQLTLMESAGVAIPGRISAYGKGSLAGVDIARFSPERFSQQDRDETRREIGLNRRALVFAFIGRITREKGVGELLDAFARLRRRHSDLALLMLGPVDDRSGASLRERFASVPGVSWLGYTRNPEKYLAMTDVLCLPSYREGFGTVVIEAAAMQVPTVGSDIPGLVDAVENGVTGILVPPRDANALAEAMETLIRDPGLLRSMKSAAGERCLLEFDSRIVNRLVATEYARWLSSHERIR